MILGMGHADWQIFPALPVRPHQNAQILSCREQRTSTRKLWRRQLRGRRLRRLTSGRSLWRPQLLLLRQQKSACAPLTAYSAQYASCHCPMIRQIACPFVVHMAAWQQDFRKNLFKVTLFGKVAYSFWLAIQTLFAWRLAPRRGLENV